MVQQWRRTPPGKALQALVARRNAGQMGRPVRFRQDLLSLEVDEFEDLLRAERMSSKMVERELAVFRELKAQQDVKTKVRERRAARAKRYIGEELSEYAEAELRRTLGVAAGDIIKEMREEDATKT